MAVGNFVVIGTSPHRLRYRLTADGAGGGTQNRTRTQMIGDCAAGPLKAYLRALASMTGFTNFNMNISVNCRSLPGTSGLAQVADNDANSIDLVVTAASTAAEFEIIYNHSMVK